MLRVALLVGFLSAALAAAVARSSDRATADRPDEALGPQIHAVYAVPSDRPDQGLDTAGVVGAWLNDFNDWLAAQSGGTRLRLDTFQGQPDVTFIRLAETDATLTAEGSSANQTIFDELQSHGLNDPNKKYVVVEQGGNNGACGWGGAIAVMYIEANPPGYTCQISWAMLVGHEIFHMLGAVNACAPHHTSDNHVSDPDDLMAHFLPTSPVLDPGHDDYWGPPGDDHLPSNCPASANVANSVYLTSHPFHRLSVTIAGKGSVNVYPPDGPGLDCSSPCAVEEGAQYTLTADPDPHFHFAGWTGTGCSGTESCSLTVTGDTALTATFVPDPFVSFRVKGKGRIAVAGVGTCAKAACRLQLQYGERTPVHATATAGWRFVGWAGACRGTKPTCSVTATRSATVTASFARRR